MKLLLAGFLLVLSACISKPGPLGEKTIKLDNFDFSTSISEILPKRYEHPEYKDNWYQVPSHGLLDSNLYHGDTIRDRETDSVLWMEYRNSGSSSADKYLSMAGQTFNAANFATTLDGRIFVGSGYIHKLTQAESDEFIRQLSMRHGEPTHTIEDFCRDYDLYTWTLKDRTIKYAAVPTDESNVLKIEKEYDEDGNLTNIRQGERTPHLQGYIFVIDAEWRERFLAAGQASGGFVYCR